MYTSKNYIIYSKKFITYMHNIIFKNQIIKIIYGIIYKKLGINKIKTSNLFNCLKIFLKYLQ